MTDKWHFHLDPIPRSNELMRWHLPYEWNQWRHNLTNIVRRWLR